MKTTQSRKIPKIEALNRYAKQLKIESIHHKVDPTTGLDAFIVIHNTNLGPAIGGARFQVYEHEHFALKDAIQLANKMAFKSAALDLPHGGAKAVIRYPDKPFDRKQLFQALGRFINELNGDYITSLDAGTKPADMDNLSLVTKHVIGTTEGLPMSIDPSIYTAYGVFQGMKAAMAINENVDSLDGKIVAVQGAGHVASHLIKYLVDAGAKVITCDISEVALDRVRNLPNVTIVEPNDIYNIKCDIFSPCALGAVINIDTIKQINAKYIIGAANNQLSHQWIAPILKNQDIIYVPDYVVNAGGVISASSVYHQKPESEIYQDVDRIYDLTSEILLRAKQDDFTPNKIGYLMAAEKLSASYDKE